MTPVATNRQSQGILIGGASAIVWGILVMYFASATIFYHQSVNFSQLLLFEWIWLGPIPVFIAAGRYYYSRSGWDDAQQYRELTIFKWMLAAFFIWIIVVVVLQVLQIAYVNSLVSNIAGYFLMLIFIAGFKARFRTSVPDKA
jgi:hypothetical protein